MANSVSELGPVLVCFSPPETKKSKCCVWAVVRVICHNPEMLGSSWYEPATLQGGVPHTLVVAPLSLASSSPPLIVPPVPLGVIGSMPTYPTRPPVESTPVKPNANVCAPPLNTVLAADFCKMPEPAIPVPSDDDSIIRMMPDDVRTAVYMLVVPLLRLSVSVPMLLLPEIGIYEPEVMAYSVNAPAVSTSSTPVVIVPFEPALRLPATATALEGLRMWSAEKPNMNTPQCEGTLATSSQ